MNENKRKDMNEYKRKEIFNPDASSVDIALAFCAKMEGMTVEKFIKDGAEEEGVTPEQFVQILRDDDENH